VIRSLNVWRYSHNGRAKAAVRAWLILLPYLPLKDLDKSVNDAEQFNALDWPEGELMLVKKPLGNSLGGRCCQ
jgi:hypothetical protein